MYYVVEVKGVGFTGSKDTTDLIVDGKKQETLSVEETKALFRVTNIKGQVLKNINLYFDVGTPKGHDIVKDVDISRVTLNPKLTKVTPNKGSMGGTLITASVEGLGLPLDDSLSVGEIINYYKLNQITLINSADGRDICKSVKVEKFGEL